MAATQQRRAPGELRDAILAVLREGAKPMSVQEITAAVTERIGEVRRSSVRSFLNLNEGPGKHFKRTGRGVYKLRS